MQLIQYLEAKSLLPRRQSWIGKFHSTERVFFWMFLGLLRRITLLAILIWCECGLWNCWSQYSFEVRWTVFWCHGSPFLVVAFHPLWANSGSDFRVLTISLIHGRSHGFIHGPTLCPQHHWYKLIISSMGRGSSMCWWHSDMCPMPSCWGYLLGGENS